MGALTHQSTAAPAQWHGVALGRPYRACGCIETGASARTGPFRPRRPGRAPVSTNLSETSQ